MPTARSVNVRYGDDDATATAAAAAAAAVSVLSSIKTPTLSRDSVSKVGSVSDIKALSKQWFDCRYQAAH